MNVLLIEDDPGIASFLVKGLSSEGYHATVLSDGAEALLVANFLGDDVDIVLLDLGLPKVDGVDILQAIRRRRPNLAVIVITARHSVTEKVKVLDAGANDYVTKPFAFEELLARIRATLRQRGSTTSTELRVLDLRLDLLTKVAHRANRRIDLSPREWTLLEFLMRSPEQVFSREQILSHVWGYDSDTSSNIVDVYVGYLRRKLNDDGRNSFMSTIRGAGYRLLPPG
jgi:DNA-binding response OmpR family regulator